METNRKRLNKMNILGIEHKTLLLTAMLFTSGMVSAQVVVKGTLYGGGKGIYSDQETGLVTGNTKVIMNGGIVERSLYGGGELGSVGTFTGFYDVATGAHVAGEPKTCATGTGKAEVLIRGGQVGIDEAVMPDAGSTTYEDDMGYVFCGSRGEADSLTYPLANLYAVVKETHLEISGSALITASAYGGCENGIVMGDTHVEIAGGQIGTGYDRNTQVHDGLYSEEQWTTVIEKIKNGTFTEADASAFHECDHWPYGDGNGHYYTYDIYAEDYDSHGGALNATDGHTFYGNVFGGGSGYYPFWDEENTKAVWRRSAGRVWGNTVVDITGGHILTNVYGGNEQTDVMGNSTINMTGGTLGVPRTLQDIGNHPVTCYVFGAGKGDTRVMFNTWTNVENAVVNISDDAFIFGSVFGGGEDGHVLSNVTMNIEPGAHIGTYGYSYVDGNVFGGGRGFSGEALTAGSVGGNVTLNISGGTMLGSIYGGGRLASVGTPFVNVGNPLYGQMQADDYSDPNHPVTHGHITINISGGVIGNDYESKLHRGNPALVEGRSYGGNVYGGSMGRLTLLDGTTKNPLWPNLGKVKNTYITISGDNTIIKGSVFGGSELGTLSSNETDVNAGKPSGNAMVTINGGTIWRNVYGGSYGSDSTTMLAPLDVHNQYSDETVQVTPMQRAGRIDGNTKVVMNGGWVKKCVYGGGSLASVGTLTEWPTIHDDETQGFALSWPYEFKYAEGTGYDTVIINNGRVGITGKDYMGPWNASGQPIYYEPNDVNQVNPRVYDLGNTDQVALLKAAREDNGDVYGGGKGIAGDRYVMAHCANSNNTEVIINYPNNNVTPENYKPTYSGSIDYETAFYSKWSEWTGFGSLGCLPGAVYGGGENGHVNEDARVTLEKGLVGHNIYGGGKGTDTYPVTLEHYNDHPNGDWQIGDEYVAQITSLTAGKVYGDTYVTVNGGYVVRNVFGGGNRASVGKGNYAGGPGDYQVNGYGEKWTTAEMRELLMNSGHTYVNVYGGQIGTASGDKDDLPTGNVFGSSRGEPAPNVPSTLSPRYHYCPEFFSGYVNHTHVTIGEDPNATPDENSPRVYGSVYGGGQDGHVRWGTEVVVNDAEIGNEYVNPTAAVSLVGTSDTLHFQWLARGNVYGAGSGTGTYTDVYGVKQHSNSSGSVTHFTSVTINGGLIHRNVYGGGSLASVGPPRIPPLTYDANRNQTLATVNINGTIGKLSDVNGSYIDGGVTKKFSYGGHVFGGSRGDLALDESSFSTSIYTEVNVGKENADNTTVPGYVLGNVYGGGEVGIVKQCTEVNMNAGEVGTIGYTWKRNTAHTQPYDSIFHTSGGDLFGGGKGHISKVNAAVVKDSTVVNIKGGHVFLNVYGGGEVASVGESEEYTYTYTDANDQTISVQDYRPLGTSGFAQVKVTGGQVGPAPGTGTYLGHPYNVNIGLNGVDGYVFGGGEGIGEDPTNLYKGFTNVNYAKVEVNMPMDDGTHANRIWGSIFGGAEDGHVLGSDTVCFVSGLMGTYGTTSYDGNIFGGGRNYSKRNYTAGRTRGNITVEMKGGQLYGSIFGGGRLALTGIDVDGNVIPDEEGENGEKFGSVKVMVKGGKVGNGDMVQNWTASSMGDVFGGGKGARVGLPAPHPAASVLLISLTKNTEVEISQENDDEPTRIYGSVYGGGEFANVGHYTWDLTGNADNPVTNIQLTENTGITNVTVSGGIIGADNMFMEAVLDENLNPVHNFDIGHVFGGGEGFVDNPDGYEKIDGVSILDYMTTVGNTNVTISDDAFVKGSVYGGGLNGHVAKDASVLVTGGQIGFGQAADGTDLPMYTTWPNPLTTVITDADTLAECPHWPYGLIPTGETSPVYNPYDPVMVHNGILPSDGKSWFGNVFGGGSGYYPYITYDESTHEYTSHWDRAAGQVKGNTSVEITGGHILTCVYGGCETTDVGLEDSENETHVSGGLSTVTITGGTVGVPRTLASIAKHPVTCYVFGGGKGDPRTDFNTWTNVWDSQVTIGGNAWIYGSVFGGGEEGHVIHNANVTVNSADVIIGTTGTSYVDGNIFGGGRGFSGEALTAGVVGGDINVNISAGHIFGSVYGGGRLASVGTRFTDPTDLLYGQFVEDIAGEEPETFGHVNIDISGGTIGNRFEYAYADPNATTEQMATWQAEHHMPYTEFDADNNNHLKRTKGGNVFGGSMGRLTKIDGTTINPFWPSLGKVKQTTVVVRGNAVVKSSVYGGGEFGTVRDNATVRIQGGTVGTRIANPNYNPENPGNAEEQYHFGSVYGGGFGSMDLEYTGAYANDSTANGLYKRPVEIAGRVYGNTFVYIEGGQVLENVFGGGELASIGMVKNGAMVNGVATVEMTGGQVGPLDMTGLNAYVYGGSKGIPDHGYKAYCNVNSTSLTVDMALYDEENDTGNRVWGSLFGGGSDGHVLGDALVLMRQGTLGTIGVTSWDGNIFGGGRNYSAVSETAGRVGGNVEVTVTGGHLLGSVFGGGRLGSVGIDEDGVMQEDAGANTYGYTTVNIGSNVNQNEIIIGHPIYDEQHPDERVGGNVYGGGKGMAGTPESIYPKLAKVKQTEVNIMEKSGMQTWIEGSVFGSGEDGHVLQDTYVNIFDGQIGGLEYTTDIEALTPCTNFYHGNVYGGGRGVDTYTGSDGQQHYSLTAGHVGQNTFVNIYGGRIVRSVYGGGNLSSVGVAELETTGLATVNVLGGSIGFDGEGNSDEYEYRDYGNVFGSGHGMVGNDGYEVYKQLAYVKNTHVTIDSVAMVYGSVFGGGEDGHVRENTLVDVKGGVIGQQDEDFLHGNVYGGGRGIVRNDGYISPTAGEVFGHATVNIMQSERKNSQGKYYTPLIWNNVYGGGSRSVVSTYKVVNMSAGTVHDHVFGGSRDIPAARPNKAPRWVNMWGGTIEGNLYGCSHNSNDDVVNGQPNQWASFINLSGGTIKGDVFGAGYGGDPEGIIIHEEQGGLVNGSVGILIGKNAIQSAFDGDIVEIGNADSLVYRPNNVIPSDSLNIFGNVYAGADDVIDNYWGDHVVSGYSNIYIDGTGYDSEHNVGSANNPYMYIGSAGGGIYGSGNNCEAGEAGHNILVREYGTRNPNGNPEGEFTQASRSLTTIQRGGTVVLENTNMNLSGASDISFPNVNRKFGVVKVSDGLYVANASGIVLGSGAQNDSVMIDSVKLVKSVYLPTGTTSAYSNMGAQATWDLVGIQGNTTVAASLYRLTNNGTTPVLLSTAQENVIIFKDKSKLRVRYKDEADGIKKYGQLEGFFRMRGDAYDPYDITESFAYARPKTASFPGVADDNVGDGGFLSYNVAYNYFTDEGAQYTKTNQHPYRHPYLGYRDDHQYQEYRLWVDIPKHPKKWYVDGTRGWGHDNKSKKGDHAGIYPDTPKKTIFGEPEPFTYDDQGNETGGSYGGIVTERFDPSGNPPVPSPDRYLNFIYSEDIIYVVGALTEFDNAILRDSITGTEPNEIHHPNYPLRLFRYPGGHKMSNGQYDNGAGGYTPNEHSYTVWGAGDGNVGPGANYGAMLNVKADSTITMKGVVMDGLYDNSLPEADSTAHMILPPNNTYGVTNLYNPAAVIEPLVITNDNSTLSVGDSTVLMRGYNNTNAAVWYTNPFAARDAVGIQGGAMYVDTTATVNVSGKVYITDNKQYLKIGDAEAKFINSNVYLPTFDKHLYITNTLFEGSDAESASKIGITSPMGNDDDEYVDNTFSPVAVADKNEATSAENHDIAADAWANCNFLDDQGWFFVNKNYSDHQRTTYYDEFVTSGGQTNPTNPHLNDSTVFFGWTWANIVRSNPGENSYQDDGLTVRIKDAKGLAWLISMTSGMNGVGASSTDFTGVNRKIKQTADVDLLQYVWVPIGSPAEGYNKSFAGNYDGQGHLIKNLYIEYIGIGDSIYERHDYGLFGYAFKGEVYRTFVVSGEINPVIANANLFNVGGLVGRLDIGKVSNSEAAVALVCPDESQLGYIAGGLIGSVQSSMVHSSMAMPSITVNDTIVDMPNDTDPAVHSLVGGLIGSSTSTSSAEIRNSFVNALYDLKGTPEVGGLLGNNDHTIVRNCYVNWHGGTPASSVFKGVVKQAGTGSDIDYCYVKQGVTVENFGSSCGSNCFNYTPTVNADQLGYMYYDNLIEGDTTLMARLNINAKEMNRVANDSIYSYWARPGLAEINGDLPVLLLNEFDVFVTEGNTSKRICHQGNFRSLSTYAGGVALQYGGPVRDDDELKSALVREQDGSNKDCLFIYGDVRSVGADFEVAQITQDKVSIHEDVSIIDPGKLTEFANTYVGISFDNSCGHATSTPGINYGLLGMGGYLLPRDWHMFSSPLMNAPLGFNYGEEDNEPDGPSNNPWVSVPNEFNWLSQVGSDECNPDAGYRYWMNTFDENNQSTDGYFPTRRGNLFEGHLNELFIVGDDECLSENLNRYPYGMDFYTWNEPQYHWINFKRNGPNHWHSDEPHNHLSYVTEVSTNHTQAETDINESKLISSKGYMAAITKETFMQSHGYLNNDSQSIMLTNTSSSKLPGWNLVGNPFHGYLDFNQIVTVEDNLDALSTQYYDSPIESVFYVVYNADKYENDNSGTAFRYYPVNGSRCGEYAERYLHPHQGFYVKAKDNRPLEFNKDMLVTRQTIDDNGAESHFRDERPSYPLVNLYLSSDQGCADVTVIEFERPNWGGATKLKELRVGDGLFYAQHDDTHYAALFAQQGIDRVPLWFEAKEDDIFTIKWNTANGDFHSMYLIDNIAGVQYDMIRNNSYTFEGHKGDYPSRFLIVFNVTDVEENIELNSFVFFDGSQWMVTGEGQLEFIDMNGQVLWVKNVDGGQSRVTVPEVASGMYLFRLTNGKETKVQKVIVNR